MDIKVISIGSRMPASTRRVVVYFGRSTQVGTPVGTIAGMADGAVRFTVPFKEGRRDYELEWELTPAEAKRIGEAFRIAAQGVEKWQEVASGFNRVRVRRADDGTIQVTHRGRTRPMRLSRLRGSRRLRGVPTGDASGRRWAHDGFTRPCGVCSERPTELYVAADDLREHGIRVPHVEVCPSCIEKLANLPEEIAEVVPIAVKSTKDGG